MEQLSLFDLPIPAPPPPAAVNLAAAAALLANLPQLLASATPDEQRALCGTVLAAIWLRGAVVKAWQPHPAYLPLFQALYEESGGATASPAAFPELRAA